VDSGVEGWLMDPFRITEPTCISFSGGRTSAYMLWRVLQSNGGLPSDAVVCFANTGKEDEATLRFVRDCEVNWGVKINWLEYRNDEAGFAVVDYETASRDGEPFDALTTKKKYLPNPVTRFCSEELKGKTITKFSGLESDQTMVGVRADEPSRIPKLRARGLMLPLVDANVDKPAVRRFWKNQPFDLGLEEHGGITSLGNCDLCFLKGAAQIMSMIQDKPERAVWWVKQEKKISARFRSDRPTYSAMLRFSQDQRDMFDAQEEGIPCFCGE
jgi:3'-phosphoadenosine 5'-phosphosulfate sulfotransferase (PAPS reductase)/FAD synthetase